LQKPAAAKPDEPVMKTRGLRLQARAEESRAGEGTSGAGSVDLQIAFDVDSARLLPEAQRQLAELARALRSERLTGRAFQLAGHTDATGRADHNRGLSLARANSVRDYLSKVGVDTATLSVAGYGADRPLEGHSPNDPLNRRVEIRSVEPSP
jgi:outer membrane protein OmpA-like peptidoglycan-associated protein